MSLAVNAANTMATGTVTAPIQENGESFNDGTLDNGTVTYDATTMTWNISGVWLSDDPGGSPIDLAFSASISASNPNRMVGQVLIYAGYDELGSFSMTESRA